MPQMDAALDVANVERIAEYIAAQTDTQYLLVTHRPQVTSQLIIIINISQLPAQLLGDRPAAARGHGS